MKRNSNAISFENQVFYIGIDVHKRSWTVTIRTDNMALKTFTMNPCPDELAKYLKRNYPGGIYRSTYEAGFCGFWIHRKLVELGVENCVINPADVPTTHKQKVSKTDKVDSRKLAKELENQNLNPIYVPDNWHQQLRSLCRLRYKLTNHSTRLKNRIKGHLHYYGIDLPPHHELAHWSGNFIKYLEQFCRDGKPGIEYLSFCIEELKLQRQRIAQVTARLRKYAENSSQTENTISNLTSIPGIGFVSAITLYTEIMKIDRFPNLDTLCSFVGLVPSSDSSGEDERTCGITPRKNRYLRYLIIEAAWVAARSDPAMLKTFTELSRRMKKSAAIIRIAKKLLNRIRFVWINKTPYQCLVN